MPTLYWNQDTNQVSTSPYDQSVAQIVATRGVLDLRIVCQKGDVNSGSNVLLDVSKIVGIVIRDPANLDAAGYLAGPTVFTRGASASDGYIATTSTDTSTVRALMQVGNANADPALEYPASAALYFEPTGGGDAVESQPFPWTITAKYYETGTPPADLIASWPSPAQLNAAVAQAAASIPRPAPPTGNGQFLFGNMDGSVYFGLLPVGLSAVFEDVDCGSISIGGGNATINSSGIFTGDGSALDSLTPGNLSGPVPIAKGGTGVASAAAALTALGAEAAANRGAVNGYAPLGSDVKVPSAFLPSYVDDVLEFANLAALPSPGETGKIYVTLDTNFEYRWSGSTYIRLVSSPGTTDTLVEGSSNLYFTNARVLSAVTGKLPASVTGIRKGAGFGASDVAAVPGADVAPFHRIVYDSFLNNGTTISYGPDAAVWTPGSAFPALISDSSGIFYITLTTGGSANPLLATITFNSANGTNVPGGLPPRVAIITTKYLLDSTGLVTANQYPTAATGGALNYYYFLDSSVLNIYLIRGAGGPAAALNIGIAYYIPPA